MSVSSFGTLHLGEPVEVITSLCKNGRYAEWQGQRVGIRFEYPPINDDICIGFSEFDEFGEELGQEIRLALEQQLNLNSAS